MNHSSFQLGIEFIFSIPLFLALLVYVFSVVISNRKYKKWPFYRSVLWVIGLLCVAFSVIGPFAELAHMDFTAHMLGHLSLGMIAPLLMVTAKPITLLLRTLPISSARQLSRLLKSGPVRFYVHPITSSLLNVGGLWILYTTDLFNLMHHSMFLYVIVHIHVFAAGYIFTASMIYSDPVSHRYSFVFRSTVLILALAGHGILSKYIYAHPPTGVPITQAEHGGMIMYYGGDVIDLVLISILCYEWYKSTKPKSSVVISQ